MAIPSEEKCVVHIGLDDFDLYLYGCTTHASTYLLNELAKHIPLHLLDYPNLVRLNPSIPWKTRGNGAIALRVEIPCTYIDKIIELTEKILMGYYEKLSTTLNIEVGELGLNPGVIIALDPLPNVFHKIYILALTDVIPYDIALSRIKNRSNVFIVESFYGRGIVGAAAAIGWIKHDSDYTYELITYRSTQQYLEPRCLDVKSVIKLDELLHTSTFNNIDPETGKILIAPHSFDPVLYGIRGDYVDELIKALNIVKTCEPITAWTLFRSNQATDAHAIVRNVNELRMYRTAKLKIRVLSRPVVIYGGHVILRAGDTTGSIDLVFFKPSKLDNIAKKLTIGDEIVVQGHVKPWKDIPCFHVEKLVIVKLSKLYQCSAPRCPLCSKRMTKSGFGKGYKCLYCKYTSSSLQPECREIIRMIDKRLYLPPPSEQKHLIKPLQRYGKEKSSHPHLKPKPLSVVSKIIEPRWFL
ncbi:MAG: tRNA(Ile)(2)-agmatinylcytidine synthase [Ignisphaera sp.]|uniref:tRNA(Ile2) 2-agmatinylcytidine synthetase TiaS n=1 Tax=Ignisphaera aggregans TaxID=334771 RepID=A0A7C4JJL1_9CREN